MKFLLKKPSPPLDCYSVVAAYGKLLELYPTGSDGGKKVELPYDVELIKAALVKVALDAGEGSRAFGVAKEGFVLLDGFIEDANDPSKIDVPNLVDGFEAEGISRDAAWTKAEAQLLTLVLNRTSKLEREFDARVNFERSLLNA